MRSVVTAALCAVLFAAPAVAAPGAGWVDLRITVWAQGKSGSSFAWRLRCPGPNARSRRACARLAPLRGPFAPVPPGTACTEIYGGPQVADVRGVFRGRTIRATFSRVDGCQIGRWNRVRFLFEPPRS